MLVTEKIYELMLLAHHKEIKIKLQFKKHPPFRSMPRARCRETSVQGTEQQETKEQEDLMSTSHHRTEARREERPGTRRSLAWLILFRYRL